METLTAAQKRLPERGSPTTPTPAQEALLRHAAKALAAERKRRGHYPRGHYPRHNHRLPADDCAACCASIRPPSRRWPYSLVNHTRTAPHCAALLLRALDGAGPVALDAQEVAQRIAPLWGAVGYDSPKRVKALLANAILIGSLSLAG